MSRFNRTHGQGVPAVYTRTATSAVRTTEETIPTANGGGTGFKRDPKSELFITAVSNLVGQDSMYESAKDHDLRYRNLVYKVAQDDPWFVAELARWLRREQNLRTVAMVTAAELAASNVGRHAKELRTYADGVVRGPVRYAVEGAIVRPDEAGEMIAYWKRAYPGTQLPKGLKRGIASRVRDLYNERAVLKWDSDKNAVRMADVLELTHPAPAKAFQSALFKYLIDDRHKRDIEADDLFNQGLETLHTDHLVRWLASNGEARKLLDPAVVRDAGMTWEDVLSLGGQHGLDKKALWESIIPSMGYMALLRNLRNIANAGVSNTVMDGVVTKLQDADEVARSRQLPMRFLSAHRATAGDPQWELALSRALDHSLGNIPQLAGNTLILVDTSGSMRDRLSERSDLKRWDAAVVFGLALAARAARSTVVSFSSSTRIFQPREREPLLRQIERWKNEGYFFGSGTDTLGAVSKHWNGGYDRLVIITDEQVNMSRYYGWSRRASAPSVTRLEQMVPTSVPTYTWNLAGYEASHLPTGSEAHAWHAFGGLNDGAFKMIPLLEAGTDAGWPWEHE